MLCKFNVGHRSQLIWRCLQHLWQAGVRWGWSLLVGRGFSHSCIRGRAASPSMAPAIPASSQESPEHTPSQSLRLRVCADLHLRQKVLEVSWEAASEVGCWGAHWLAGDEDPFTAGGGSPHSPWHVVLVRLCKPPLVVNWDGIPCSPRDAGGEWELERQSGWGPLQSITDLRNGDDRLGMKQGVRLWFWGVTCRRCVMGLQRQGPLPDFAGVPLN